MAVGSFVERLTKEATDFVVTRKGTWGHEDWEAFCDHAFEKGIEMNEYNRVALGNLLEAVRYFYQLSPSPPAPAKKKAVASKKVTAKKTVPK